MVSLEASRRGARANLLLGGIITTSSTLAGKDPAFAINGILGFDFLNDDYWSSEDEIDPWFMVKLPKPVYVKTIFYLDR